MFLTGFDDHRHTVRTEAGEVSYVEIGTGPVALFVHGIATSAYLWQHLIPLLADTRRCVAVDLPLHGRSPAAPGRRLTVCAFADTLVEVCTRLGVDQVDLVAHDTGGAVAQVFAARHPELIRTLTLTNCDTQDNMPPAAMAATVELARAGQLAPSAPAILADPAAARALFTSGYQDPSFLSAELVQAFLEPLLGTPAAAARFQELIAGLAPDDLLAAEPALRALLTPDTDRLGDRRRLLRPEVGALAARHHPRRAGPGGDRRREAVLPARTRRRTRPASPPPLDHRRPSLTGAHMDIALLHEVTEDFAAYLSEATDGDLTARTPCPLWTIADLYHHLLDLNSRLGQAFDPQSSPQVARGGNPLRETIYRDSARYAADVLARAADAAPAGPVWTPFGELSPHGAFESLVTNTLVHTWDIAKAMRFDFEPPRPDVLDIALGCLRGLPPGTATPDFAAGSAMADVLSSAGRTPEWRELRGGRQSLEPSDVGSGAGLG